MSRTEERPRIDGLHRSVSVRISVGMVKQFVGPSTHSFRVSDYSLASQSGHENTDFHSDIEISLR
jgi:hypothetical protein